MAAPRNQSWISRKMMGEKIREKMREYWDGPEGEARRRLWSERAKAQWSAPGSDIQRRKHAESGRKNAELRWGRASP